MSIKLAADHVYIPLYYHSPMKHRTTSYLVPPHNCGNLVPKHTNYVCIYIYIYIYKHMLLDTANWTMLLSTVFLGAPT